VEPWQISLLVFFVLAPLVLMVATWGNERLTFRGRPLQRDWKTQVDHPPVDDHH